MARAGGEVEASPAVVSVRAAIDRFQLQPQELELIKVEEQTVKLEMELFVKERETLKILDKVKIARRTADCLMLQLQMGSCHGAGQLQAQTKPSAAAATLAELKQAKHYLNKNTVEMLRKRIEEEKSALAKTQERFRINKARVAALEQSLSSCASELQVFRGGRTKGPQDPCELGLRLRQLSSERDNNRKLADEHRREIAELTAEIERCKSRLKTVEFQVVMAKKMKEAAEAAGAAVHAGIMSWHGDDQEVTAEEAMHREVGVGRRALEEALKREESATKAKLAAEEALRRRRSLERAVVMSSPADLKSSAILDVNGMHLVPAVSIGQIVRGKMREWESGGKVKVSLAQVLSQSYDGWSSSSPGRIHRHGRTAGERKPWLGKKRLGSLLLTLLLARRHKEGNSSKDG